MFILKRIGPNWQLEGHWGAIEIPHDHARRLALQILADGRMTSTLAAPPGPAPAEQTPEPARETRAQRALRLLTHDLATGAFSPGQHLDECVLAHRYQVSRTPIREALFQLTMAGKVVRERHKGCRVA